MSDPTPPASSRVCPSCGTENWPSARFCAECGTRLVDEAVLERDFDSTVADVIASEPEISDEPLLVSAEPVAEVPLPTEWPATFAQPPSKSRNTTLWVVLGIFAFILACCCGLTLLVTISSANDSALQRELSLFAIR